MAADCVVFKSCLLYFVNVRWTRLASKRHASCTSVVGHFQIKMKFQLNEYKRNISQDDLVADLKRVALETGKDKLTTKDYKKFGGKYSIDSFSKKIGSWFDCLELAGLDKTRSLLNRPDEELFENIKDVWVTLGKQPSYDDMDLGFSKFRASTYARRFGSWRKALEEFVDFINQNADENTLKQTESTVSKNKTPRQINWRLRFLVMRRDNFKCKLCGASPATDPTIILHVDHILPYSKGGQTIMENLQTSCSKCNLGKSDLLMESGE